MKYTRAQLIQRLSAAPLRTAYIPHVCRLCTNFIERGRRYHRGEHQVRGHEECVREAIEKVELGSE